MEIWDLYDKDRKKTGIYHTRGEIIPNGYYHLVVHVWIKNNEGKYLISQRSENRPSFPLMWECVGGSVLKAEDSIEGALREVKEEVGIDLDIKKGKVVFSKVRDVINNDKFNDIVDIWLFNYDGDIDLSKATTDEVRQVKWLSKEEMRELYDNGMFVKTLSYIFDRNDI